MTTPKKKTDHLRIGHALPFATSFRLHKFFLSGIISLGFALPPPFLHGANDTWKSAAPTGTWISASNWVGGNVPGLPGGNANDTASFTTTSSNPIITVDSGRRLAFLSFGSSAGSFTFNGGPLLLTATWPDGLRITGASTGQTINAPISTNAGGTFGFLSAGSSGAYLRINGTVTGAPNVSNTLRLGGTSANTSNEINGRIANGSGTGALGITKEDTGTWVLKGPNTFTGATVVNRGTLVVGVGGVGSLTSAIRVNAGTLKGSGRTNGNVTIGNGAGTYDAFVSPGDNVGTFSTTSSLSLLADATLNVEFNSSSRISDKLVANGVTINGNSRLLLTDLASAPMPSNTQLLVIDNTSSSPINGTFSGLANGSLVTSGSNRFSVNYSGGTGNDLVLTVTSAAPVFQSDSLVESIGVGVHVWVGRGAGNATIIKDKLVNAGVRHARDWLAIDQPEGTVAWQLLRDNGIRMCYSLTPNWGGITAMKQYMISNNLVGSTDYVEGPNEPNNSATWAPATITFCTDLFNQFRNDPLTANLPILAPALALRSADMTADHTALGDISAYVNYGNSHPYPGGALPTTNLVKELTLERINVGNKPMIVTETGYHNAMSTTNGHNPASERATAIYLPRLFLEYLSLGVQRTYWFDLLDNFTEAQAAARGLPDIEAHFGLVRYDFSEKPAYLALKNLITIMKDPGPAFVPTSLAVSISGSSDAKSLLFQRRDGKYQLALWRNVSVWSNRTDITPATATVTVTLPTTKPRVDVYFPTRSSGIINTHLNVSTVQVPLEGEVAILRF